MEPQKPPVGTTGDGSIGMRPWAVLALVEERGGVHPLVAKGSRVPSGRPPLARGGLFNPPASVRS